MQKLNWFNFCGILTYVDVRWRTSCEVWYHSDELSVEMKAKSCLPSPMYLTFCVAGGKICIFRGDHDLSLDIDANELQADRLIMYYTSA